jgi:hypothetical protein
VDDELLAGIGVQLSQDRLALHPRVTFAVRGGVWHAAHAGARLRSTMCGGRLRAAQCFKSPMRER